MRSIEVCLLSTGAARQRRHRRSKLILSHLFGQHLRITPSVRAQGVSRLARPSDRSPVSLCFVIRPPDRLTVLPCISLRFKIRPFVPLCRGHSVTIIHEQLTSEVRRGPLQQKSKARGMHCFMVAPANQHRAVRHQSVTVDVLLR